MTNTKTKLFETLRQPEYTGTNRCPACTWVNSAIAVLLAVGVAYYVEGVASVLHAAAAGGIVLGLSAGVIYFRGYLVPGTPELTKKYVPLWLLHKFGKGPLMDSSIDRITGPEDVLSESGEKHLRNAEVIRNCPESDGLCLTESFRQTWHSNIDTFTTSDDPIAVVADHFDRPRDEVKLIKQENLSDELDDEDRVLSGGKKITGKMRIEAEIHRGRPKQEQIRRNPKDDVILYYDGRQNGVWPSRVALFADLAALDAFEETRSEFEDHTEYDMKLVRRVITSFLDTCPSCDGTLVWDTDPVGGGFEVVHTSCADCDTTLFERRIEQGE